MSFIKGQRVHVEFDGVVYTTPGAGSSGFYVSADDYHGGPSWVPVSKVRALDPADWPPQPGDLWSNADGELFFAFKNIAGDIFLLAEKDGNLQEPGVLLRRYPDMKLKSRKAQGSRKTAKIISESLTGKRAAETGAGAAWAH
jgi:hypothetical protein